MGSHASTWAQLVKCARVEGVTLQRLHVPVLTPSRGCKQERGDKASLLTAGPLHVLVE